MSEKNPSQWSARSKALHTLKDNWNTQFPGESYVFHKPDVSLLMSSSVKIDTFKNACGFDPFSFVPSHLYNSFAAAMDSTPRWDGKKDEDGVYVETVLDHTLALHKLNAQILYLAPDFRIMNQNIIRPTISIHDIPEILLGDKNGADQETDEQAQLRHEREDIVFREVMLPLIPESNIDLFKLHSQYENKATLEAKYVKWLDGLQGHIRARELAKSDARYNNVEVRVFCDGKLEKSRDIFVDALKESGIQLAENTNIIHLLNYPTQIYI